MSNSEKYAPLEPVIKALGGDFYYMAPGEEERDEIPGYWFVEFQGRELVLSALDDESHPDLDACMRPGEGDETDVAPGASAHQVVDALGLARLLIHWEQSSRPL